MRLSVVLVAVLVLLSTCGPREQQVKGGPEVGAPDAGRQEEPQGLKPTVVAIDDGFDLGGRGPGLDIEWETVNQYSLPGRECSSVFIGARVLLTARHCLRFDGSLTTKVEIEYVPGRKETFDCVTKNLDGPPDLAACLAPEALVDGPAHFSSVDLSGMSASQRLLFTGASILGGGMTAAPVRGGWGKSGSSLPANGNVVLKAVSVNGSDLASACERDSGGGVFRAGSTTGPRALVGIVRTGGCGNPRLPTGAGAVNLGSTAARDLLKATFQSWSDAGLQICGFNADHTTLSACKKTS